MAAAHAGLQVPVDPPPLLPRGGLVVANETDGERRVGGLFIPTNCTQVSLALGETAHLYCPKKEFEHFPASEELELRWTPDT